MNKNARNQISLFVLPLLLLFFLLGCSKNNVEPDPSNNGLERFLLAQGTEERVFAYANGDSLNPKLVSLSLDTFVTDANETLLVFKQTALDWWPLDLPAGTWKSDTFKVDGNRLSFWVDDHWAEMVSLDNVDDMTRNNIFYFEHYSTDENPSVYIESAVHSIRYGWRGLQQYQNNKLITEYTTYSTLGYGGWNWRRVFLFLENHGIVYYDLQRYGEEPGGRERYFYEEVDSSRSIDGTILPTSPGTPSDIQTRYFPLEVGTEWVYSLTSTTGSIYRPDTVRVTVVEPYSTAPSGEHRLQLYSPPQNSHPETVAERLLYLNGGYCLRPLPSGLKLTFTFGGLDLAQPGDTLFRASSDEHFDYTILIANGVDRSVQNVQYSDVIILEAFGLLTYTKCRYSFAPGIGIIEMEYTGTDYLNNPYEFTYSLVSDGLSIE
ncbi:hypothetical protein KQI63_14240 [bacterium]|nr:hypothetical protein [bacterium]